jgi:hypothetical protein
MCLFVNSSINKTQLLPGCWWIYKKKLYDSSCSAFQRIEWPLFIELFTNRHMSAIKKNNYSICIPTVAIWLWGLRNHYLFYNLPQFLKCVLYWFPTKNLDRSWTIAIGQTGRIFFSAEDYTNMSYYNCCGIRPKHSNFSKRLWEKIGRAHVLPPPPFLKCYCALV